MNKATLLAVVLAFACEGDTPANVAGTYTLALTIQKADCDILKNPVGTTASGVPVVITQNGSEVQAVVQGLGAVALGLGLGTSTFTGTVSGNDLDLSIAGKNAASSGTCAYTLNARLAGKVAGDALSGSITYTFVTNHTADCGFRDSCQDVQLFNGTRPPTVKP